MFLTNTWVFIWKSVNGRVSVFPPHRKITILSPLPPENKPAFQILDSKTPPIMSSTPPLNISRWVYMFMYVDLSLKAIFFQLLAANYKTWFCILFRYGMSREFLRSFDDICFSLDIWMRISWKVFHLTPLREWRNSRYCKLYFCQLCIMSFRGLSICLPL